MKTEQAKVLQEIKFAITKGHTYYPTQASAEHDMFDVALRPVKDTIFDPLCTAIPLWLKPLHVTAIGFIAGLTACVAAATGKTFLAEIAWVLNRSFDCLDGALARRRKLASDLGGFLDLLSDFVIYSAIPICSMLGQAPSPSIAQRCWLAVAVAEASFYINNFVLFYIAAITEKRKAAAVTSGGSRSATQGMESSIEELTSVTMRPALVEGVESGLAFSLMLAWPEHTASLCWGLAMGVAIGTAQRVFWLVSALTD